MRVIAGSARGRRLHSPADLRVRPTADRVKEALFSALASRFGSLDGLAVLDLFAGSGGLGIEALSRGAASVIFVDQHPGSLALTRKNLQLTGLDGPATLIQMDARKALYRFQDQGRVFDIILVDPPYADKELTGELLSLFSKLGLIAANGVAVFETDSRYQISAPESLHLANRKVYGDTALSFFEPPEF